MPKPTKYPEGFDDYLRSQVELDSLTGNLHWTCQTVRNARKMDRPVGGVHNKNYLSFRMMYKGVSYNILNHRAVFFLTHGYWPYGVDHKDGNGFNNTPDNLRECDQKDNNGNCAPKHGRQYKGIYLRKDRGTWQVQGTQGKASIKLGNYTCKKEAALAYNYWALYYFGDFARLNKVFEDHPLAETEHRQSTSAKLSQ